MQPMLHTVNYTVKQPKSMLNKGTGFLRGYTHTLNPYAGCTFGCSYCYVRRMPVALFRGLPWGRWVDIKEEAAAIVRKELRKAKAAGPVTIFMSSSTDPYQPIEYKARITHSLLKTLAADPPDFLLVQTRSPLVRRDLELLQSFGRNVRVSMTVETDLEAIRKHFTPYAPPLAARMKALEALQQADVPTQAAVAPVLPSSERFGERLRAVTSRVCIDDYFMGDGSGGKRTKQLEIEALYRRLGLEQWYNPTAYKRVIRHLEHWFDPAQIFVSQAGFDPSID